ncbi:MAG: hypothetical protein LBH34_03905 [Prevotellaceae bacterium]|jgi:type III secretory pathway component EscR|nr:hypothetical protein [Prevotellaceae bacterium]
MKRIEIDKNILLKEVSLKDVNIIFNMIDSQRDYLREFLNFINDTQTSDYTRKYVKEMMENRQMEAI